MDEALIDQWNEFVTRIHLYSQNNNVFPQPTKSVSILVDQFLKDKEPLQVLDLGSETGRNVKPFTDLGHHVTINDVAPKAIEFIKDNPDLEPNLQDSFNCSVSDLPFDDLPVYDVITANLVASYIDPFENTWIKLSEHLTKDGYVAGAFLGAEHKWVGEDHGYVKRVFVNFKQLEDLFEKCNCQIVWSEEEHKDADLVLEDKKVFFHIFYIIAQKKS
jgi:SAM-dependent methyltransferase